MNYALQNIVAIFLVIATVVVALYFLFLRQNGQYIPDNWGDLGCMHILYVKEDSLQPTLTRGVFLSLNQCIKNRSDISNGSIVSFVYDDEKIVGIVEDSERKINKLYYTVNIGKETVEILSTEILAYTTLQSEE